VARRERRDGAVARDALLVLLAVTTGATDAASFLALGHVFSSVITGNLVLLGVGAAHGDVTLLRSSGIALAAYAAGVALAAPGLKSASPEVLWPRHANRALVGELLVLAAFAIVWEASPTTPATAVREVLLALAAVAMGAQSETVRTLGPFSTTYLTSTLTGLVSALARREVTPELRRSAAIIAAAVAGAAATAGLLHGARSALPALQLAPLAAVIGASHPLRRKRRDAS
jgi:uncharacterized membrane protein YoaK (UPF0700 family)